MILLILLSQKYHNSPRRPFKIFDVQISVKSVSNPEMDKITCKMIFIKDQDQWGQRSKIKIKDHFSRNDLRSKIRSFQKITYYIKMDVV